ncbi:hypothetical protein [Almyronema epifaneia]|uniref:DUF3160 domain-containing protein n=1 Tax=Almyronema epifaneia S1 TaxID=2991925 RepID=A0ABW6ICT1_9CYAN
MTFKLCILRNKSLSAKNAGLTKFALLSITLVFGLFGCSQKVSRCPQANQQTEQEWENFRETYPYHLQTVALSEPLEDGCRILLISEPPPHLNEEYFQSLAGDLGEEAKSLAYPVGYDGWVADVLITLPPLNDLELSEKVLSKLYIDLYGTTYKANISNLPIEPPTENTQTLDLSVSAAELHQWTNNGNYLFKPVLGGDPQELGQILTEGNDGVFISNTPGIVVWVMSKEKDLSEYNVEARQFFLDSDLIIGAITDDDFVAVLGRERVENVLRMPPLRFETALTIAATAEEDLAQSYERNHLFAGRLDESEVEYGDWAPDWAPIYLSSNLVDTELGSLLNITDQILKSWSLNGEVEYVNFYDYPYKPSDLPPFDKSLNEVFEEQGSILFNWNTEGVGYTTRIEDYSYLTLYRTGALSVIYGTEISLEDYEEIAYDYFSSLNNPDLARVVQYTALYQIFKEFGISSSSQFETRSMESGNDFFVQETARLIDAIISWPLDKTINQFEKGHQALINELYEAAQNGEISYLEVSEISDYYESNFQYALNNLYLLTDQLKEGDSKWPEIALSELSYLLASPRDYNYSRIEEPEFAEWLDSTSYLISSPEIQIYFGDLLDSNLIMQGYVEVLAEDASRSWVRTPSIVLSKHSEFSYATGGHNLDSKVTRLQQSLDVPPGKIRRTDDGSILYNPRDVNKIHSISRELRYQEDLVDLSQISQSRTLSPEIRSPEKALLTENHLSLENRGFNEAHQTTSSAPPFGYRPRNFPLTPDEAKRIQTADTLDVSSFIVERSPNGYVVLRSNSDKVLEAYTLSGLHEALGKSIDSIPTNDKPIQLFLVDFTPDEARALTLTADIKDLETQKVLLKKDDQPFEQSIALLKRNQYDWGNATVRKVETEPLVDSFYDYKQTIEVEVPSSVITQKSLIVRIKIFIKGILPDDLVGLIQSIIKQFSQTPPSTKKDLNSMINNIQKQIKKEHPDIDLEFYYDEQAGDLIISGPSQFNFHAKLSIQNN